MHPKVPNPNQAQNKRKLIAFPKPLNKKGPLSGVFPKLPFVRLIFMAGYREKLLLRPLKNLASQRNTLRLSSRLPDSRIIEKQITNLPSYPFNDSTNQPIMITTHALFAAEGIDNRSLEFIAQAIEKNNLPGFDYFEFKRAVAQLSTMNLDEATAHKSAFATAATLGITKEKLIETAGYYRNVVEKEKEHFSQALDHQNNTKVSARQLEVSRLRDQIERHKIEIARLQDEIAGYLNQADAADASIKQESEKLEKSKIAFEKAHQSVIMTIDRDVEQMHKHL